MHKCWQIKKIYQSGEKLHYYWVQTPSFFLFFLVHLYHMCVCVCLEEEGGGCAVWKKEYYVHIFCSIPLKTLLLTIIGICTLYTSLQHEHTWMSSWEIFKNFINYEKQSINYLLNVNMYVNYKRCEEHKA